MTLCTWIMWSSETTTQPSLDALVFLFKSLVAFAWIFSRLQCSIFKWRSSFETTTQPAWQSWWSLTSPVILDSPLGRNHQLIHILPSRKHWSSISCHHHFHRHCHQHCQQHCHRHCQHLCHRHFQQFCHHYYHHLNVDPISTDGNNCSPREVRIKVGIESIAK